MTSVDSGLQAANRGNCTVQVDIASASELIFCNIKTNLTKCATCGPTPQGQGKVVTSGVSPIFLNLQTPITFYISSATGNTITLTSGTNTLGPITISANGCQAITVDDDCTVHL